MYFPSWGAVLNSFIPLWTPVIPYSLRLTNVKVAMSTEHIIAKISVTTNTPFLSSQKSSEIVLSKPQKKRRQKKDRMREIKKKSN